ncbi:hypothetical protein JNB70_25380, partial [Rhizobium pusense]|nr:hypothetical protein [Agrobacterium pusense]
LRAIRGTPMFDGSFYLANNPDVREAGIDPLRHYLVHGWREKRDPSPTFSTARYLSENPDVEQAQLNPLVHYLRFGRREGRVLPVSEAVTSPDAIGTSATGVPVPAAGSSGLLRADAQATQQGGQPAVQSALDAE